MKPSTAFIIASVFVLGLFALILARVGWIPSVIIGGSGLIGLVAWRFTTYDRPLEPEGITAPFLVAVGAQFVHVLEEVIMDFPGEMHVAFGTAHISQGVFVGVILVGATLLWLAGAWGVHRRHPLGNFVLWFFLIGPAGFVNVVAHLAFPVFTEGYYFPGLATVWLPAAAGLFLLYRVIKQLIDRGRASSVDVS